MKARSALKTVIGFAGAGRRNMGNLNAGGKSRDLAALIVLLRQLRPLLSRSPMRFRALPLLFLLAAPGLHGRQKKQADYGFGLAVQVPAPESEVLGAVQEVVQDGIVQGSVEYNKDKYVEKAEPASSSSLFSAWTEAGTVFYKVRKQVVAPTNFKDSGDSGTLAVRYVVLGQGPANTLLRIDAVFVEDFRHTVHPSNGSVESGEFKAIQDQIDRTELKKKQATEAEKQHQQDLAQQVLVRPPDRENDASRLLVAESSAQTLEQHVQDLRRQAERLVKAPGGQLKSAPFHTATTVKDLPAGAEVVILIVTPYWYGIETEDGQHGWLSRDQLESLP
jgi:hypothetical protein